MTKKKTASKKKPAAKAVKTKAKKIQAKPVKPKKPTAQQLKVIYNIETSFDPNFNVRNYEEALKGCIENGWITKRMKVTFKGKDAAGLILREVPLPPHLADLIRPGIRTSSR